ncbi:MAG: glycoside hydrolase family 65 protein [Saprospiraceae bacterium]|nr:glycoside hydrolase family 65 protein [Saprospiraceae bacterium]
MHNSYLSLDPWKIIEEGFDPENHESSESIFALGNGKMGQRAMFEEKYSGETLQGSYIAGVYYPDKTRVGWWKNGYPEYFAKVLNAPNWIGIGVVVDGETLDLHETKVSNFTRTLDMQYGVLERAFTAHFNNGAEIDIVATRFISMAHDEVGAIRYSVKPVNKAAHIVFSPYINGDVYNSDANYDEKFWELVAQKADENTAALSSKTRKTDFHVGFAMKAELAGGTLESATVVDRAEFVGKDISVTVQAEETASLYKYVGVASSMNYEKSTVLSQAIKVAESAIETGFDALLEAHQNAWTKIWETADIKIHGDVAAQQGIRFNIFHMYQTYTGKDERLNVGPKGFTGEKYGGSTYWDTEAYCFPFFLNTADYSVGKQLLIYRHNQLQKAIENGEKLGFHSGAALYPMVTMNGEECHNEWEITFEEIHRNGAIAFAIFNYVRHSGDHAYLASHGLDVLIAISRFWAQRVNWSEEKEKWVMLGVTGPNEYENNINNNWYTNKMAAWTLSYSLEAIDWVKTNMPERWSEIQQALNFDEAIESVNWKDVIDKMYYPYSEKKQIFLQQDNFLDKDILPADMLPMEMRPINQFWSWDRILRSCYIKQADTLQGFYFFEDEFSDEELERHFDFYEPITVHESSLSPCVHVVLAAKLDRMDKAYELYLRTSRLDLDDYNKEAAEGLHITSMAGTWMSVVEGFGGLRVKNDQLHLNPKLPAAWEGYEFTVSFRERTLNVDVSKSGTKVSKLDGDSLEIQVDGQAIQL